MVTGRWLSPARGDTERMTGGEGTSGLRAPYSLMTTRPVAWFMALMALTLAAGCIPAAHTVPVDDGEGPGQLVFAGSLRQTAAHDTIRISVAVRNTGDREEHLSLGECSLDVSFYRADRDTAAAVWQQSRWQPHPPPGLPLFGRVCLSYALDITLQSGESSAPREYSATFAARDVLGDSLPEGTYRVIARAGYNDSTAPLSLGPIELRRRAP
jgi:hypothetical protein